VDLVSEKPTGTESLFQVWDMLVAANGGFPNDGASSVGFAEIRELLPRLSDDQFSEALDLGCDLGVIVADTRLNNDGIVCRQLHTGENSYVADFDAVYKGEALTEFKQWPLILASRLDRVRKISAARKKLNSPKRIAQIWEGTLTEANGHYVANMAFVRGFKAPISPNTVSEFELNELWPNPEIGQGFSWIVTANVDQSLTGQAELSSNS
jgi:hypothetical protein